MRTARDVPTPLLCRNSMIADDLLIGPARGDPRATFRADACDLTQAARLLLYNVEYALAERAHELLRVHRPNAADHAGAEIFLDTLDCGRRGRFEKRGAELDAMGAIIHPGPPGRHELPG